jgi:hypothetical protein
MREHFLISNFTYGGVYKSNSDVSRIFIEEFLMICLSFGMLDNIVN